MIDRMSPATTPLLGPLLHGKEAEQIFAPERQLAAMLQFELALAEALEAVGLAVEGTAEACAQGATGFPDGPAQDAIAHGSRSSGNLAIPFVQQLTEFVRHHNAAAADYVHFGATSQDLLDTALVLQLREFCSFTDRELRRICATLVRLAQAHRGTVLAGRTWMQQGPPVTFALKATGWLSALLRHLERLAVAERRVAVLQFGGAVGTLSSLGDAGPAVTRELAQRLGLAIPEIPWHTERDSLAELAGTLGLIAGTCGKIARDLALLLQNEVAEVQIAGTGGSSTMPHKRNPVALAVVLSAAVRAPGLVATMLAAMPQEHERGLGGWHAEWETLPDLARVVGGAIEALAGCLEGLTLDEVRMRDNLTRLRGLAQAEAVAMALAPAIGRPAAHKLLEAASKTALAHQLSLLDVLRDDPVVTANLAPEALRRLLEEPLNYLGSTDCFVNAVLAHAEAALQGSSDALA